LEKALDDVDDDVDVHVDVDDDRVQLSSKKLLL